MDLALGLDSEEMMTLRSLDGELKPPNNVVWTVPYTITNMRIIIISTRNKPLMHEGYSSRYLPVCP